MDGGVALAALRQAQGTYSPKIRLNGLGLFASSSFSSRKMTFRVWLSSYKKTISHFDKALDIPLKDPQRFESSLTECEWCPRKPESEKRIARMYLQYPAKPG